jgi:hypothetical protein
MDAIQRKELLHLRIEQANEEMQIVLAKMVEVLFQTYQPEVIESIAVEEEAAALAPPSWAKPMTKAESLAELREANAEGERGEVVAIEELEKAMEAW